MLAPLSASSGRNVSERSRDDVTSVWARPRPRAVGALGHRMDLSVLIDSLFRVESESEGLSSGPFF